MLHVSGSKRCPTTVKGCMVGCAIEGVFNGKPDEKSKPLLSLDTTGKCKLPLNKTALLFWFFGGFRCSVPLFIVMLVVY